MKKLQRFILLLILTLNTTFGLVAAPRWVYLDRELKESKLTKYVEILGYTDSTIIFRGFESKKVFTAKAFRSDNRGQRIRQYGTCYWPLKGEKVLIVIDKINYVSLFAIIVGANYMFWSPQQTMSMAMFYFKKPAFKLPYSKYPAHSPEYLEDYDACWDGCLLPVDKLKTYGRQWKY